MSNEVPEEFKGFEIAPRNDVGYVIGEDGVTRSTEEAKAERMREHYRSCGIPDAYLKFTLAHYTPQMSASGDLLGPAEIKKKESVKKLIDSYLKIIHRICGGWPLIVKRTKNDKQGKEISSLILRGGIGSGKTMLASIIAKEAAAKYLQVRYLRYTDLMASFMPMWGNEDEQSKIVKEFGYVDLVIIDGLKDVNSDDNKFVGLANNLERLAKVRADSGKPTIITIDETERISSGHPMRSLIELCTKINLPSLPPSDTI